MATGTGLLDTYDEPIVYDPPSSNSGPTLTSLEAVAALIEIQSGNAIPEYRVQAFEVDVTGAELSNPASILQDLSPYLVKVDTDAADMDGTADVPDSATFTISEQAELTWGKSIVALYQLIRSTEYNANHGLDLRTWVRFSVGHYVVTTPSTDDLDAADIVAVTGYGKNYLLQSSPNDSFSFDEGTTYLDAVTAVFKAAGLIADLLSEVCDNYGYWITKKLPDPRNYPMDENTYLDIVNDLMKASGSRPIHTQNNGRWVIQSTKTWAPETAALRWRWAASEDASLTDADLDVKVVVYRQTSYKGDVWGVPNQWVFIQEGLTFEPVEGSGLYTVNNTTFPPSDQITVGRIVRSTQQLPASGQDDLVTQGDAIVKAALSEAETINLSTAPWPVGRYLDVFQVTHSQLPGSSLRRVQAQSWRLPLWGQPMEWKTNVVAPS